MSNEVVHTLRPGIKNWVLNPTNYSIRHESGFEVRFFYEGNGDASGYIIAGYPELDGIDEATRQFRTDWVQRMLVEAGACFDAAIRSYLH